MTIAIWLMTSVSGVFLALRLYCKFLKKRGLWWDDHVLVASWLALLSSTLTTFINIRFFQFGQHTFEIPASVLPWTILLNTISTSMTILAAVWSKTSFGMTLLRIISGKKTRLLVWGIIVSMNLAMSVNVVTSWVQCYPSLLPVPGSTLEVQGNSGMSLKCWDGRVGVYYGIFAGAYSGLMDIVLALLPWSVLWNLQIRRKEKIGIAVAMGMGVFAGGAAIVKCSKIPVMLDGDFTYEGHHLIIWGSAEVAITIMAASIPVLRVLVRELREATTRRRYGYGVDMESGAASGSNRNAVAQKKKSPMTGTGTGEGTDQLQRSNSMVVTVTSGYRRGRTSSGSSSLDADLEAGSGSRVMSSEEKRLSDANPGKIVQTQEITVRYFEKDDDDVKRIFEGL
ncbi:hypothetical protein QBC37DRAFT_439838 [Rhypophila decipiens]|uniref:Rhodopsin domain-containing protein n=1 Tax=Rhypophila decipiens TaxID=261697 RepID=A0AAN6Y9I5_9PEZI|nr:hypothetical protein QBC37DRAFT_439838 [Rhypophila decipiens]